jgi:hypothetical protein
MNNLRVVGLSSSGKYLARTANHFPLNFIAREEFKPMPEAIAIADQCTKLKRDTAGWKCELQRGDFAHLELAGQSYPNPILAKLNGAPPQFDRRVHSEYFGRHPDIHRKPRKTP